LAEGKSGTQILKWSKSGKSHPHRVKFKPTTWRLSCGTRELKRQKSALWTWLLWVGGHALDNLWTRFTGVIQRRIGIRPIAKMKINNLCLRDTENSPNPICFLRDINNFVKSLKQWAFNKRTRSYRSVAPCRYRLRSQTQAPCPLNSPEGVVPTVPLLR